MIVASCAANIIKFQELLELFCGVVILQVNCDELIRFRQCVAFLRYLLNGLLFDRLVPRFCWQIEVICDFLDGLLTPELMLGKEVAVA